MSKTIQLLSAFIAFSGMIAANQPFLASSVDTQLIQAVKSGDRKAVKVLLKSGVDVNELGVDYKTALDAAVEHGHTKIALDLVQYKARLSSEDNQQYLKKMLQYKSKKILMLFPVFFVTAVAFSVLVLYPPLYIMTSPAFLPVIINLAVVIGGFSAAIAVFGYTFSLPFQACSWYSRSKKNWMLPVSNID